MSVQERFLKFRSKMNVVGGTDLTRDTQTQIHRHERGVRTTETILVS